MVQWQHESTLPAKIYGVEYAGSTHPWGGCRLGSIPSTPTQKNRPEDILGTIFLF